jgi:hypothetical protein
MGERPVLFDEILGQVPIRSGLVEALGCAYDTAAELHDPVRGSNEITFGVGLYNYAVFELSKLDRETSLAMQVIARIPFRVQVGQVFNLGCHRVGRSGKESIWSAFPDNAGAAATLIEQQPYLPAEGFGPDTRNAKNLILAHMGNPEDGLCAVYLCVPTREENGRIREWGFADLLWRRSDEAAPPKDAVIANPEEVVEEVPLARRKVKPKVNRE